MSTGSRLELHLLGGFEARLGSGSPVGFESQRARALVAYLALHRDRPLERDFLAGLLWEDRSDESARRNLRQAVYSIRSALATGNDDRDIFASAQGSLRIDPEIECWIDVEEFEIAYREGLRGKAPNAHHLSKAARLYKGDFLAGFFLRDSTGFEDWLVTTQEALREEAIETFRTLVTIYLSRGEHRYGIRYAKRLLAADPLSEEAHRQLMRLYVMAGRRTRAVAQYEHLMNLLRDELGVEPMEETTELYRSILLTDRNKSEEPETTDPPAPLIPLVGRTEEFEALQGAWEQVVRGEGCMTLVTGEAGIGKSRLVKSFVDGATSKREAVVLRGSCYPEAGIIGFKPIADLLGGALTEILPDEEVDDELLRTPGIDLLRWLAAKAGQVELVTETVGQPREVGTSAISEALLELFDLLCNPVGGRGRPLIVLLEDQQWADSASRELVEVVAPQLAGRPVWILMTSRDWKDEATTERLDLQQLSLGRLGEGDIEEIAASLVDSASIPVLSEFLHRDSDGLPLKIAELINLLWDEGKLHPRSPGAWELEADPVLPSDLEPTLSDLVQRRVRTLPTSARRLLAVAAVSGYQFDVDIVQQAADEHLSVVETCIELALERWLIRQYPRSWSPAGLERDIVLWARGARRGYFEFSHAAVREAILEQLNPIRRAVMHRDLALALESHYADRAAIHAEDLAYHWLAAQEPARALPWLSAAVDRAATTGASGIHDDYLRTALQVAERLEEGESDPEVSAIRKRLLELQTSLSRKRDGRGKPPR